jgi:phage terminase large subunit
MPTLRIPTAPVFRPLLEPARYKGAYGGRGSGKSHFFGELMVEECLTTPGTLAVCIREVQKSLMQSSKRLIESKIHQLGVGSTFKILHDRIITPGDGLIIFQGMQDATAESIKSLEPGCFANADRFFSQALIIERAVITASSRVPP